MDSAEIDTFVHISEALKDYVSAPQTDSPIEARLLYMLRKYGAKPKTQVKIGPYRCDLLLERGGIKLVIECDGEEFHQDKEKDRKRDQYMIGKGYYVMRFTGSQIFRNPWRCVYDILSITGGADQRVMECLEKRADPERFAAYEPEIPEGAYGDPHTGEIMYS